MAHRGSIYLQATLRGLYGNILFHNVVPFVRTVRCVTNRKVAGSIPDSVIGIFH